MNIILMIFQSFKKDVFGMSYNSQRKGQALSLDITYYVSFWNLFNVFHTWSEAFGGLILSSPLEDLVLDQI